MNNHQQTTKTFSKTQIKEWMQHPISELLIEALKKLDLENALSLVDNPCINSDRDLVRLNEIRTTHFLVQDLTDVDGLKEILATVATFSIQEDI